MFVQLIFFVDIFVVMRTLYGVLSTFGLFQKSEASVVFFSVLLAFYSQYHCPARDPPYRSN